MKTSFLLSFFILQLGAGADLAGREDIQRIDITEGDTLSLTCKARPTLLRSFRWVYIREGTRKPRVLSSGRRLVVGEPRLSIDAISKNNSVNLVLNLKEIRPYEAGLFMCWRQGLKPDPQVYVRVLEAGITEAEPISIEISAPSHVHYGGSVTIKCLIRPSWPGKVVWLKDRTKLSPSDPVYTQAIEESPDGELLASLNVVSIRQNANYTCQVPSDPAAEASFNLVVRVARIESVRTEPSIETVEYDQNLLIICIVSGTDDEILWLKDGGNLGLNQDDEKLEKTDEVLPDGNMKSTLLIEKFSVEDNGHYACYVPGDSEGVLVNIEGRLPRVISVKGWDFMVGEVLRLTCSTQYAKDNKEVTWLFEGEPLRRDWWAEKIIREDFHNVTHHDLSLPIPTREHVGTYTCTTPYGSATTVVREIVPPYVEESPPVSINVPVGEKLSLPCSFAGYPVPTVLWEKNINGQWKIVEEAKTEGEEEVDGIMVNTEPLVEGDKRVGERQELNMEETLPYHAGKYRCRVYSDEVSVVVETEVTTSDAATLVLEMTADEVMEGEDLKITCSVSNWEGPVEFIYGLRALGQDGDGKYETHLISKDEKTEEREGKGGRKYTIKQKIYTYALVISDVTLDDQGFYECHAGTEASDSVVVTVKQLPPEVIEVAAAPAIEGGEFFVSCTITNMPTNEEAVFYFDGRNLNEEEDPRYSTHLAELTDEVVVNSKGRAKQATYVLKVLNAVQEDSGVYHCVIGSDARGSVSVKVEAIEDVEEVSMEASRTWVGGDLVLKCRVTNWDKEVSFFMNQTMLLGEEDSRFYLSREDEGNSTVHTLHIFEVTPQDAGFYQCFTSPITSAEVNVTIPDLEDLSVVLEQRPKGNPLWIDSQMILDCRLKGFKGYTHTIEFSHGGRPYLYLDPSIKGAQVKERASLVKEKDDVPLTENELSYRMRLEEVALGDTGTWVCRATIPEARFVKEAFVDIDIFEPPKFTASPDSEISVEYGSDLILNCIASGFPVPQVMWFKDGIQEPLVNETEFARLEISSFTENDTGIYICEANSFDQFISSETKLDIMGDLKIIEMPMPKTVLTEGTSAVLRCMALSFPSSVNPFVTWSRKDTDDVLESGYELVSYTIENPTESDAGEYICKATIPGVEKTVSTEVIITRKTSSPIPPSTLAPTLMAGRLVEISGPDIVEEGKDVTLMCLVSPLLAYYKYIIVFNGTILTYDDDLVSQDRRISVKFGTGAGEEKLLRLTIRNVSPLDEGNYECTVNTIPIARHSHFIAVVPEGSLTTTTTHKKTGTTSSQDTSITSESGPTQNVSDIWDTTPPFESTGFSTSPPTSSSTGFSSTMETTKHITKTVLHGKTAMLPCTIPVDKETPIIWRLKKDLFLISVDLLKLENNARYEIDAPDDYTRNLIIHNVNANDSGVYTCLKEITPQVKIHVELNVLEDIYKSPVDERTESPHTFTTESYFYSNETDQIEEGEFERTTKDPETKEKEPESAIDIIYSDHEDEEVTEEPIIRERGQEIHEGVTIGQSEYEDEEEESSEASSEEHYSEEEYDYGEAEETKETDKKQEDYKDHEEDLDRLYLNATEVFDVSDVKDYENIIETDEVEESNVTQWPDETYESVGTDHPFSGSIDNEDDDDDDDDGDVLEEIDERHDVGETDTERQEDPKDIAGIDDPYDSEGTDDTYITARTDAPHDTARTDASYDTAVTDAPYHIAETDVPYHIAETDAPYHIAKTDAPYHIAETDAPYHIAETDAPYHIAETDVPHHIAETEAPYHIAETDAPYHIAETDAPYHIAETDAPFHIAETDAPFHIAETDAPFHIAETDAPFHTAETDDPYHIAETVDPYYTAETDDPYHIEEMDDPYDSAKTDESYDVGRTDEPYNISDKDRYDTAKTDDPDDDGKTAVPHETVETDDSYSIKETDDIDATAEPADQFEVGETDEKQEVDKTEDSDDVEETYVQHGTINSEVIKETTTVESLEDYYSVTQSPFEGDTSEEEITTFTLVKPETEKEELPKEREENETYVFTSESEEKYDHEYDHEEEEEEEVIEKTETKEQDYTYSYDDITSTTKPSVEDYPIIVATPGKDVKAPPVAEIILPCPTEALLDDITWEDSEKKILFLGSLDLAGVEGIALSPDGELRLLSGVSETKDQKTYRCLVYDYDTEKDVPLMSYTIELGQGEMLKGVDDDKGYSSNGTTRSPTSTFEFPGLEWQEVAVISNSLVSGRSLTNVLKGGGINAVLISDDYCRSSDTLHSWTEAQESLKDCEANARNTGLIRNSQSVFLILDFTVALGTEKRYGSTLIYVHNVAVNLTAHVFGPLVPISAENGYTVVECGSPVYSSQKHLDLSAFCKSSVASSILTLQEAYLSHSRKLPMA